MEERENYFSKVPTWNSNSPKFEILSDEISGRIPVVKIDHWRYFSDILESSFFNKPGVQWVYRGHRRYDWSLTPTLGRLSASGIVTDDLAKRQLTLFKQTIRGRITDHSLILQEDQIEELWSVGQHHGLSTPLLDWTYSPYVALFFAIHKEDSKEEEDNPYRSVYFLNKTFVDTNESFEEVRILEPKKDDHGRLVSQAGLFIVTPTDATLENKMADILTDPEFPDDELRQAGEGAEANILARYLCKIYIKNEDLASCLRHLRRMNVHHASLFPDLIGAADYCNSLITEQEIERKIAEKPKDKHEERHHNIEKEEENLPLEEIDITNVDNLIDLLSQPTESKEVEPGRIKAIAEELSKILQKNKLVDWEVRESVQASIRNKARILLRKYGYPQDLRDEVVKKLIEFEISRKGSEADK